MCANIQNMNLVNIQAYTEYFCKLFIRNVKKRNFIARLSIDILCSEACWLLIKIHTYLQNIYVFLIFPRDIFWRIVNKFFVKSRFHRIYFSNNSHIFQSLELPCVTYHRNDLEKLLTILLRFPVYRKHLSRHEVQRYWSIFNYFY